MFARSRSDRSTTNTRGGFTLVELLVIVACLAILAAILLPVLMRSRATSYRAQCANNLRQFGLAFYLYGQDWNGFWPCPGGLSGDRTYWAQSGSGGLQPYVKQRGLKSIWCCPLMTEWRSQYPARTYSMNSYLRNPCDVEYSSCVGILCGVNTVRLTDPHKTILLYEGVQLTTGWENSALYNYIYRCANWTYVRGCVGNVACAVDSGKPWHGQSNNYLYADGHVLARRPGKPTTGSLSTYREMYEWYVDKPRFDSMYQKYWAGLASGN